MTRPSAGALCVAALLLSGCTDEAPTASREPAPSASPAPVLTPPVTGVPSALRPTRFTAPPATSAPVRRPAADGDVDGDGRPDRVTTNQETLTVALSSGGTVTAPVTADAEPPVQGVVDVDGDGRAEVFLETTRGASTVFYTPFRYDGRRLAPLTLDGEPVLLGVGGSVTHGEGFACRKGNLLVTTSTSTDGESFDVTSTTYGVKGFALVRNPPEVRRGLQQDDLLVALSYQVDCGSVTQDG